MTCTSGDKVQCFDRIELPAGTQSINSLENHPLIELVVSDTVQLQDLGVIL
jgi:hypothetical protein